jgi:hypothetical protein
MVEEKLSYSLAVVQDCPMRRPSKGHTSKPATHSRENLVRGSSDVNFVTFAESAR